MKLVIKYILIVSVLVPLFSLKADEFSDTKETIDIRKSAMQGLWIRVKRLSPYVELKENVEYNKDLASNDASEILKLLDKTRNLSVCTILLTQRLQMALPEYFNKLYLMQLSYRSETKKMMILIKQHLPYVT